MCCCLFPIRFEHELDDHGHAHQIMVIPMSGLGDVLVLSLFVSMSGCNMVGYFSPHTNFTSLRPASLFLHIIISDFTTAPDQYV